MKKLLHGCLMGVAAAALGLGLWSGGVLDRLEFVTWAWRVRALAGPDPSTDRINVILLDQASMDWGRRENGWSWPWPREVYGPIIDFCKRQGAKAIAFDVLYTEPSVYGVADDEALGGAIARGRPFVGAAFLGGSGETTRWPAEVQEPRIEIEGLDAWLKKRERTDILAGRTTFPIPDVATNATMLANVSDLPDEDGVFRRVALFRVFDGKVVPSLGIAAYLASRNSEGAEEKLRIEEGWLHIGQKRIPIDRSGRAILRFCGPSGTHKAYSAAAVIQSELRLRSGGQPTIQDHNALRGRYVFFGFTAPGLLDLSPTPVSKVYSGVEIHCTVLDNLLGSLFLSDAPSAGVVLATLLFSIASAIAVVFSQKAWQNVMAFTVILPVPLAAGFVAYRLGFWWPVVTGEIAAAGALVGGVIYNYATEGRQKAFIKRAFRHYLSPEVIEKIIEDPSQLKLGGERRELTIFFSDLQGFTPLSERLDPVVLTRLLNDYLSDMTDIILEEGGTLDKYEGDAIIAFWNAPLDQPDHAIRACRTAIRCQGKLAERRAEFKGRSGVELKMRIGISTGEVVVGNMGSRERFDYTVMGDAANLASRLEGANKAFGTFTMVDESTWNQTGGTFPGREIGTLRVVGRQTAVRVFEPLGSGGEAGPSFLADYERGLDLCSRGEWAPACAVLSGLSSDPVSRIYAEKCRKLMQDGSAAWDGVWDLAEK